MRSVQHDQRQGVVAVAGAVLSCMAFASVCGAEPPAMGDRPGDAVVYYFKEARALTPWIGRAAVRATGLAGAGRGSVVSLVQLAGVEAARIEGHTIDGWFLVDAPRLVERGDAAGTRALASALAAAASKAPHEGAGPPAFVSEVFVDDLGGPMFATEWLLIRFRPGVGREAAMALLHAAGFETAAAEERFGGMDGAYRIRSATHRTGRGVLDAAATLARRDEVLFAEPEMIFTGTSALVPNDPGFPQSWGLDNRGQNGCCSGIDLRAVDAWDLTTGSQSIVTVVIDTGVQPDHPDINQVPGFDATGQDSGGAPVNQCDNHGTPVAGCVSGILNNGIGGVGIAPRTRVASARAFISNIASPCTGAWSGSSAWTVAALEFAGSIGARVTNNSNGYGFASSAISAAYESSRNAGIVHFASAMNDGLPSLGYPSSLPTVNAIAAIRPNGTLTSFSNYGDGLAFAAPGLQIYTTDRTGSAGYVSGSFVIINGTSFAAPLAAGVAALALSADPSLDPPAVEALLRATALDLGEPGYDPEFGWGLPRADAALVAALTPACPADLTGDGVVDTNDLGVLLGGFGCSGTGCPGELTGDGVVDSDDLGVLLGSFGCVG